MHFIVFSNKLSYTTIVMVFTYKITLYYFQTNKIQEQEFSVKLFCVHPITPIIETNKG